MNRKANVEPNGKPRSVDPAALAMIEVAAAAHIPTPWDRLADQQPQCKFGTMGICCRNCFMGPCRINPFGERAQVGICGADSGTIVARNLLRHICTGTSAHSDHSRDMVHALLLAAEGKSQAYRVRGIRKLHRLAEEYGISRDGRTDEEIAQSLADFLLDEFGKQKGTLANLLRAPEQQRKNWTAARALVRGIDREVVTGLHMTHVGADNDAEHLLLAAAGAVR